QSGSKGSAIQRLELIPPIIRKRPPKVSFDPSTKVGVRDAYEPPDELFFGDGPSEPRQNLHVDLDCQPLRVYEHAVAVEDYELEHFGRRRLREPRRCRKRAPLALEQLRKAQRRPVLEVGSDGLQAYRQALSVEPCRKCSRRQTAKD